MTRGFVSFLPRLIESKESNGIERDKAPRRARGPLGWDLVESEFSVGPYVDQATIGFRVIHFCIGGFKMIHFSSLE